MFNRQLSASLGITAATQHWIVPFDLVLLLLIHIFNSPWTWCVVRSRPHSIAGTPRPRSRHPAVSGAASTRARNPK
jgi:hypothetical protein